VCRCGTQPGSIKPVCAAYAAKPDNDADDAPICCIQQRFVRFRWESQKNLTSESSWRLIWKAAAAFTATSTCLQFAEYTKVQLCQKKVLVEGTLTDAGDKQGPRTPPRFMESLNCGGSLPVNATRSQAFLR
jgi:hypothetical protein